MKAHQSYVVLVLREAADRAEMEAETARHLSYKAPGAGFQEEMEEWNARARALRSAADHIEGEQP